MEGDCVCINKLKCVCGHIILTPTLRAERLFGAQFHQHLCPIFAHITTSFFASGFSVLFWYMGVEYGWTTLLALRATLETS